MEKSSASSCEERATNLVWGGGKQVPAAADNLNALLTWCVCEWKNGEDNEKLRTWRVVERENGEDECQQLRRTRC
jgi:hypothetical protein